MIKIEVDYKLFYTTKETLLLSKYFDQLFKRYPNKEIYYLDTDYDCFYNILEYLRNGESYEKNFPTKYYSVLNNFMSDQIIDYNDVIELNVGGKQFKTTKSTLKKCKYFDNIFLQSFNIFSMIILSG